MFFILSYNKRLTNVEYCKKRSYNVIKIYIRLNKIVVGELWENIIKRKRK
jgi:hypothetical protein